jgi:mono/diheme cytochrome c family protein
MRGRHALVLALAACAPLLLAALAVGAVLFLRQGGFAPYRVPQGSSVLPPPTPATLARGEYVARLGNCITCHTTRGGVPYAGGRAFDTGFGTVYSTNLTPDPRHGLGDWSLAEFRHTLRTGVSRHGVLYPVFPFAHFARLDDADLDALFAYLRSLPPDPRAPTPNRLSFPASWRTAMVGWRMLFYRPPQADDDPGRSPEWKRGRYLVEGLGHCTMCHGTRGMLGSLPAAGHLAGGTIPGMGWYAPPLDRVRLARFSADDLAAYLRSGTAPQGTAYGPMAEVVYTSLRWLHADDARAMTAYLMSLPGRPQETPPAADAVSAGGNGDGASIYREHCADCHGRDGRGKPGRFPPLVDSVAARAPDATDAVRMILYGAVAPTTPGNPHPYSMPPFVQTLASGEVAAVANYIRASWGGRPPDLSAADVDALHGIVLD